MKKNLLIISIILNFVCVGFLIFQHLKKTWLPIEKPSFVNHQEYRNNYFSILPVDSNQIVFAGDSHIEHFEVNELFNSVITKNRGINGSRTTDLLKNIRILLKGNPSKIFIEMGTNDLFGKRPIDSILITYNAIIDNIKIKSPKTKIYILSVLANKYDFNKCRELNEKIMALPKIKFINLAPYLQDNNGLKKEYDSGDHVHLNGEGYLKWRDILKPYLQ